MTEQQTPDREKKIAEIREALEKATPGPWEYEMWEGCADVYPTTGRHVPICQLWTKTEEPMENAENNAHLIANAPEWLGFLLEERDKLIEALLWYADEKNYRREYHSRHGTLVEPAEAIYYDGGQRARDILKEIGVNVE